jgi:endo-1,4-beta-xylanase
VKDSVTVIVTGDVNGDGKITVTDMIATKSHLLGKSKFTGAAEKAADTNGDGKISITDFIQLKAHILGKSAVAPN